MPQLMKVRVHKGSQGFGFILSNQAPCVVSSITEGGPAEHASLKTGDEILEVNNKNVSRSSHEQVVRMILKCTGPWVLLKIRRYSEPLEFTNSFIDLNEDTDDLYNSISETVEKVVEDLKSGNLFKDADLAPKRRSGSSTRRSVPSMDSRETSFEGNEEGSQNKSSRGGGSSRARSSSSDHNDNSLNVGKEPNTGWMPVRVERTNSDSIFKAVVGYLKSVELPNGSKNLSSTSADVLKTCIRGLHVTSKKVYRHVLITISLDGVKLTSSGGKVIVTFPLNTIAFTCSCPDDTRFFGIVTRKILNDDSPLLLRPYDSRGINERRQPEVCSCHIFMVDEELSSHKEHEKVAQSFGLLCKTVKGICEGFPKDSSIIFDTLNLFFRENSFSDSETTSSHDGIAASPKERKSINDSFDDSVDGLDMLQKLRIREEHEAQKVAKDSDKFHVMNLTKSPFRQRKPIPKWLLDEQLGNSAGSCEELWGTDGSDILAKDMDGSKRNLLSPRQNIYISPSISDQFDEDCPPSDMLPRNCNMDDICNDLKKECEGDQSLELLLKNPFGLQCFEDFLKKEHSEENIIFWKEIEKFRTIEDPVELRRAAAKIYRIYLADGAERLVNVDQKAVKKAEEKLINPDAQMFDLQQQQIFMLMKYDCFPRFLKSEFNRREPIAMQTQELEEDVDHKDYKKRKTQWYMKKKSASKDSGTKEITEQNDKKKTLLSLWGKGKGPKQDGKVRDKPPKQGGKLRGTHDSQSSLSDGGSKPSTPNLADERKTFVLPTSPSEIKELLGSATPFCRVVLPNGSSNVVLLEPGGPIRQILHTCCSRQNLMLSAYDIFVGEQRKPVDLDKQSILFADEVFYLERKVQFRFDLPNKRSVAVRDSPSKTLFDAVEPIMRKNGYDLGRFVVHLAKNNITLSLQTGIAAIENKHLVTEERAVAEDRRLSLGNVSWKPPSGTLGIKELASTFKRQRQISKDDSSLAALTKQTLKPTKSQEELNKFARRGSLEGHRSYFTRIKQGIKNTRTARSKSIDHTKYAAKANKQRSKDEASKIGKEEVEGYGRQTSTPSFPVSVTVDKAERQATNFTSKRQTEAQKQRELSAKADLGHFRPASEFFLKMDHDDQFEDRRNSVPGILDSNITQTASDLKWKTNSNSKISSLAITKSPTKQFLNNKHHSLVSAVSDPELAVRRGRTTQVSKTLKREVIRTGSDVSSHSATSARSLNIEDQRPKSDADISHIRRLSKNLLTWRARDNSCDSASSSATEDLSQDVLSVKRIKDSKRPSSSETLAVKQSPRSPRIKHKKMEDVEISIANSPVYAIDAGKLKTGKARPLPISLANESEILRGLDLRDSFDVIQSPDRKNASAEETDVIPYDIDDSFENAIERGRLLASALDNLPVNVNGLNRQTVDQLGDHQKEVSDARPLRQDSLDLADMDSLDRSNSSSGLDYEFNITVTGSVNDETLIMEDKDTGLDLSGLMDMTNIKRNRRGTRQKGDKDPRPRETAITFV